ncbi:MAG: hypothetical protein AMDU4_FER2C00227G0001 [Ferroplasma sp. Type II]|nr:MAG: hypothetical protein AMDU4_FER2C00227G0001 [Ferroplasma sp. Type II]
MNLQGSMRITRNISIYPLYISLEKASYVRSRRDGMILRMMDRKMSARDAR